MKVVICAGPPTSGKTTVLKQVIKRLLAGASEQPQDGGRCQATRRGDKVSPCATSGAAHSVVSSMKAHSSSRWLAITPRFIATMKASVSAVRDFIFGAKAGERRASEDM